MLEKYFQKRIHKVKNFLREDEAFFITLKEEIFYFTGFSGEDSYLLIKQDEVLFFTDLRFTEQIKREKKIDLEVLEISLNNKVISKIKEILKQNGIKKLYLSKKDINYSFGEMLAFSLLEDSIEIKDTDFVKKMRIKKDAYEIEIIKQNLILTEISYKLILPQIEENKAEIEIAGEIEYFLRKNGAEKMAFETIVASGERSVLPHGKASEKKIQKDEIILLDYGIKKNGYCSDFTRCFYFGKIIDEKILKIRDVVEKALKEAEKTVRAGIPAKEVHMAAWNVIDKEGFSSNFWHSTGHGIGLEIHEEPSISGRNDCILEEGMIFTIEPGIYLPGVGGIRLEDIVVVREEGAEVLTYSDYEL